MSKQKEAKLARRMLRAQAARALPLRVVPSKKGLTTTFAISALLGFLFGIAIHTLRARFFHG